jgi:glycosyltransferase involved in cell wall biosynthesis
LLGGAERWIDRLVDVTRDRLQWVGIGCLGGDNVDPVLADSIGRHVPIGKGPGAILSIARSVDVMIGWGFRGFMGMIRPSNCKTIMVAHGMCEWTREALADSGDADLLVAVAKCAIRPFPEGEHHRVQVAYNCANSRLPEVDRETQRERWGIGPGRKVLGYLGRISPEKYPEAIPRAISRLPDDWVGVLVGPHQTSIESEIQALGVRDRIIMPGKTWSPGDAISAFDIACLPSHSEGCSIALIEFWTGKVPVVATPVGLVEERPDLVRVIPNGADGNVIADAVMQDWGALSRRAERVDEAYRFVTEQLSEAAFRSRWLDLIGSLAPKPRQRPQEARRGAFASRMSDLSFRPKDGATGLTGRRNGLPLSTALEMVTGCPHRKQFVSCHNKGECLLRLGELQGGEVSTRQNCVNCIANRGGYPVDGKTD